MIFESYSGAIFLIDESDKSEGESKNQDREVRVIFEDALYNGMFLDSGSAARQLI